MSDKLPPKERRMPFITGGDWSVGMNSRTSLQQAELLSLLGQGLQKMYGDVAQEGVPDYLASIVEKLEKDRDK